MDYLAAEDPKIAGRSVEYCSYILEAHKTLMGMSESNREQFRDAVRFMEDELGSGANDKATE